MADSSLDWNSMADEAERLVKLWPSGEPGGAILGFDADGVRFSTSNGVENLSTLTPFVPETVVRFASVTKHVFCAMVLSHPDRIRLDDPLGKHLPELQPALAAVTVERALSMTGGLPDVRECLALHGLTTASLTDAAPLYDYLAHMDRLNFPPGDEVSYSNTGYRLVETAMDRMGLRFDDFVQQRITTDLGQPMTAAELWGDPVRGLVPGYYKKPSGWQLGAQGMHLSSAGSLCGSAVGMAHWLRALVAGQGKLAGLFSEMSTPRALADGRAISYGLGLVWTVLGGRRLVGHGGGQPGFKTYFLIDPVTQAGVVITSNREEADTPGFARQVMAVGLGVDAPRPIKGGFAPEGLYVAENGPRWVELKPSSLVHLGADEALYDDRHGGVMSLSGTAPIRLTRDGAALVGEIGLSAVRLLPAPSGDEPDVSTLDGRWEAPEFGAAFDISDGQLIWGIGPQRQSLPLVQLGGGRWLFSRPDSPSTRRICLNLIGPDRLELVTARTRMIEYRRLPI
jgi:CubicO group peptidase (beta-lactamase class C family)